MPDQKLTPEQEAIIERLPLADYPDSKQWMEFVERACLAILSEQNTEIERLKRGIELALRGNEATAPLVRRIEELKSEVKRLREGMEKLFPVEDGYTEQMDVLIEAGLLVPVPSDDAFREEWGQDETSMYVWAWHPLALLTPTTKED
jgi:hypothetical protein